MRIFVLGKKAPDTGVASLKTIFVNEGLVNGRSLDTIFKPLPHFIGVGFDQRRLRAVILTPFYGMDKGCRVWQRCLRVKPAMR